MRTLTSLLVLLATIAPHLDAQLTVGTTVGAVHYDQQSTTTSLAFNPEFRLERPRLIVDATGGYTAGSDGGRVVDEDATLWGASRPFSGHYQITGLFQVSATNPARDSSSSALFGLGEVAWALADRGVAGGLGIVQASIQGTPSIGAFRSEFRGWLVTGDGDVTLTGAIEPTLLSGSWFTEFAAGAEWTPGAWDLTGGLRLRQASGAGVALGGAASASLDVTRQWAVELDAGRYLRDPFQGLPAGYFVSLGVRVKVASWKEGTGEGVGAASLGDVGLKSTLGRRGVSQLPAASGGTSGRGTGNGHRP